MGMKDNIKRVMPDGAARCLRHLIQTCRLWKAALLQADRFNRSYSRDWSTDRERVQTRVMFLTHQIEKGLGHREFRYNFGKHVFETIPSMLDRLEVADRDYLNNPVYRECMAALHEYAQRHADAGVDISWQRSRFTPEQWNRVESWNHKDGGSVELIGSEKRLNGSLTFEELAKNRHSLREYSNESVDEKMLRQAIELATRAPSACNRQAARVKMILNPETIGRALKLQGGVGGYPVPPALLLVTADLRVYMNLDERNEGYIDGGLFGVMLILALESYGLASCPLHTMFDAETDKKTRDLLQLPDWEVPIMYVEVGHYPDAARTPQSTRLPVNDLVSVIR